MNGPYLASAITCHLIDFIPNLNDQFSLLAIHITACQLSHATQGKNTNKFYLYILDHYTTSAKMQKTLQAESKFHNSECKNSF